MSNDHMLELPKAVWAIKIVQSIIALLVLAFSAYSISVLPNSDSGFCIFTAIFSGVALVYYFVSIHSNPSLFNWVAILVLECFNVLWWLIVWALLATLLALAAYLESANYNIYNRLSKRYTTGSLDAAVYLIYVTLALGLINWILYIVTLIFISMAVHRHRKAGKPMSAEGSTNAGFNNASRQEKHDMQPMPATQAYPQQPMHYEHQPQQAPAYPPQQQGTYPPSPVPANTHEAYGGNRYP